ncbi:hypothetical protein CCACVL1_16459 [Corchorus capsularis]|uniref:Uncharacterized protein n=1 Tax=Corchorus capsularis TaxID=210143 RepID=A0A1R3HWU0_COCAP|nr:hypothetical protein CCACVL1_16459 [Corchorus capsularis]
MKTQVYSNALLVLITIEGHICKPSGKIRAKKPKSGQCTVEDDPDCCKQGKLYTIYKCSPPVSNHTKATLTLKSFEDGRDGSGPSKCDNQYHSDDEPLVHFQQDGSTRKQDVSSILISTAMERVSRPKLWMNVTRQPGVTLPMVTIVRAITTLWLHHKQFGRPCKCL